uniref:Ion_trans domain-containing protein n=1 Tax=Heterorhabditis bacteriophora TaxID=37862 RepID=A0A1I7XBC3_HETBA
MLQQPVPELRSFQSLSKYAGGPRRLVLLAVLKKLIQNRAKYVPLNIFYLDMLYFKCSYLLKHLYYCIVKNEINLLIIARSFRFTEPALHCLRQASPPRSWALTMVMTPWFDRVTMFVILINCITLGENIFKYKIKEKECCKSQKYSYDIFPEVN